MRKLLSERGLDVGRQVDCLIHPKPRGWETRGQMVSPRRLGPWPTGALFRGKIPRPFHREIPPPKLIARRPLATDWQAHKWNTSVARVLDKAGGRLLPGVRRLVRRLLSGW